jgi:hypothetical protein
MVKNMSLEQQMCEFILTATNEEMKQLIYLIRDKKQFNGLVNAVLIKIGVT